METYEIEAVVNEDGILNIKMPAGNWTAGTKVKVTLDLEEQSGQEDWAAFVRRTYGSIPDFPSVRLDDLPDDFREPFE